MRNEAVVRTQKAPVCNRAFSGEQGGHERLGHRARAPVRGAIEHLLFRQVLLRPVARFSPLALPAP